MPLRLHGPARLLLLATALVACQAASPSGADVPPAPPTLPPAPSPSPAASGHATGNAVGDAHVLFVVADESEPGLWTFTVTVEHPDTGWDDYADGWDVVTPAGDVIKSDPDAPFTRLLLHPHETEQPFTRSQSGLPIPGQVTLVIVRAHDLVDGFGGREITVDLTAGQGPGFTVNRATNPP